MIDLLRRHVTTAMIAAILLACATVTAILWAGLRIATGEDARQSARIAPPVQAQLLPVYSRARVPGAPVKRH
jgi:hypothetical protein